MYPFGHTNVLKIILFRFELDTVAAFHLLLFCERSERRACCARTDFRRLVLFWPLSKQLSYQKNKPKWNAINKKHSVSMYIPLPLIFSGAQSNQGLIHGTTRRQPVG